MKKISAHILLYSELTVENAPNLTHFNPNYNSLTQDLTLILKSTHNHDYKKFNRMGANIFDRYQFMVECVCVCVGEGGGGIMKSAKLTNLLKPIPPHLIYSF